MFKLSELAQINNGKCNAQDAKDNGVFPLYDRSTEVKKSDKYLFDCEAIIVPGISFVENANTPVNKRLTAFGRYGIIKSGTKRAKAYTVT